MWNLLNSLLIRALNTPPIDLQFGLSAWNPFDLPIELHPIFRRCATPIDPRVGTTALFNAQIKECCPAY